MCHKNTEGTENWSCFRFSKFSCESNKFATETQKAQKNWNLKNLIVFIFEFDYLDTEALKAEVVIPIKYNIPDYF